MKAVERKTGLQVIAVELENGKFEVEGKTYAASTFKKYYKVVKEEAKPVKVEVELYTFTNMKIQGTFVATLVGNTYHIDTKKKGLLIFNADTLIQENCKNIKFANKIVIK